METLLFGSGVVNLIFGGIVSCSKGKIALMALERPRIQCKSPEIRRRCRLPRSLRGL